MPESNAKPTIITYLNPSVENLILAGFSNLVNFEDNFNDADKMNNQGFNQAHKDIKRTKCFNIQGANYQEFKQIQSSNKDAPANEEAIAKAFMEENLTGEILAYNNSYCHQGGFFSSLHTLLRPGLLTVINPPVSTVNIGIHDNIQTTTTVSNVLQAIDTSQGQENPKLLNRLEESNPLITIETTFEKNFKDGSTKITELKIKIDPEIQNLYKKQCAFLKERFEDKNKIVKIIKHNLPQMDQSMQEKLDEINGCDPRDYPIKLINFIKDCSKDKNNGNFKTMINQIYKACNEGQLKNITASEIYAAQLASKMALPNLPKKDLIKYENLYNHKKEASTNEKVNELLNNYSQKKNTFSFFSCFGKNNTAEIKMIQALSEQIKRFKSTDQNSIEDQIKDREDMRKEIINTIKSNGNKFKPRGELALMTQFLVEQLNQEIDALELKQANQLNAQLK